VRLSQSGEALHFISSSLHQFLYYGSFSHFPPSATFPVLASGAGVWLMASGVQGKRTSKGVLSLTGGGHMCACMGSEPAAGRLCQKTLGKQQGVTEAAP